jgi:hypothetical protein
VTPVNPLTSTATAAQMDEYGFFPVAAEGRWFILEVVYPAGSAAMRTFPGCHLRWELV